MQIKNGFTLVEISIALFIIGLLIAGIVTGKSMIEAAELRGLISQLDKIDTAVNSFKTKYNCLPGDCINATNFFPSGGCPNGDGLAGTTCNGDGSSYINHPASGTTTQRREEKKLWEQLALARLIEGQYTGIGGAANPNEEALIGINVPKTPIAGLGISVWHHYTFFSSWITSFGSDNLGMGVHVLQVGAEYSGQLTYAGRLTVAQVMSIDSKMDDGIANNGLYRAAEGGAATGTSGCTQGVAPNFSYGTDMSAKCRLIVIKKW